jgi:predicted Zn-dependent protease
MKHLLLATTLFLGACQTVPLIPQHPLEYTLTELNKVCCKYPVHIMNSETIYAFVVLDEGLDIRGVYITSAMMLFADHECEIRFIIAHEYGHLHLKQKVTINSKERRQQEADADKFAGDLLEKSGCSREYGANVLKRIYNRGHAQDNVATYPTLKERVRIITNGH